MIPSRNDSAHLAPGVHRTMLAVYFVLPIMLALSGCGPKLAHDRYRVAVVSERANTILATLLADCAITDGHWKNDMGPGCTTVFATWFGYDVGQRRNRQDIVRIGEVTASIEASGLAKVLLAWTLGQVSPEDTDAVRTVAGYPALFVSATRAARQDHQTLLGLCHTGAVRYAETHSLPSIPNTAIAIVSAELYKMNPQLGTGYLEHARRFARRASDTGLPAHAAMAWARIARASGDPEDLACASAIASQGRASHTRDGTEPCPTPFLSPMLSLNLAMLSAYLDLSELQPQSDWSDRARQLLDLVFSDLYFNGRILVHDFEVDGRHADRYCSGCNFLALYLADRVLGDRIQFRPVPPPRVQ